MLGPDVISDYHTFAVLGIQIIWMTIWTFKYYGVCSEAFRKVSAAHHRYIQYLSCPNR